MRRSLYAFKPPTYDKKKIWDKFHELIIESTSFKVYADAAKIIIPILADSNEANAMNDAYNLFKKLIETLSKTEENYPGPELRAFTSILEVCSNNPLIFNKFKT